jgi:hypothetical protein
VDFRSLCARLGLGRAARQENAMRARKALSLVILPWVLLPGLAAPAAAEPLQSVEFDPSVQTVPSPIATAAVGLPETAASTTVAGVTPAATADGCAPAESFGVAMTPEQLDEHRGGDALIGQNYLTGTVSDNVASRISTGSNAITEGSFANSSGLPTVIQNTGANVLIQNATVLNVRFGN